MKKIKSLFLMFTEFITKSDEAKSSYYHYYIQKFY